MHTELVQIGAETGRFSSRNPNLQNLPSSGTAYGKRVRNLFVAPPGHKLIVADYSQIEPRVIAMLSKDPTMVANYRDNGDLYTAVGERMGVDRKAGKVLVLSMAYGVGPDKMSGQIGCSIAEARDLLESFADQFPQIVRLKSKTVRQARARRPVPYVTTMTGRRRYLPDLRSDVQWQQSRAERQAFNTLIQGSAADIIKLALVLADQKIPEAASLLLTVHDEIVASSPDDLIEETSEAIRSAMEDMSANWIVPLVATFSVAQKWGSAK